MPANLKLMHFTARHFAFVLFAYPKTWLAAGNSVLLGALTATLVCGLALGVSWVVLRGRGRGRGALDQLSMMPLSMPAMVFALGLLWVYVRIPLPIYGTVLILLIAYSTHYLPFGVRSTSAALRQLHPELEEAARVSGASWLGTMRRITLPLVQPTVLAAWVLLFVMAMQEVSSSVLLYTSHSIVLSVAIFDLWENGNPSDVAALGVRAACRKLHRGHAGSRHAAAPGDRMTTLAPLDTIRGAVSVEALAVSHGSVDAVRGVSFSRPARGSADAARPQRLRQDDHAARHRRVGNAPAGRIVIDGVPGLRLAARPQSCRPISATPAMVFQSYALWPHMTIAGRTSPSASDSRGIRNPELAGSPQRIRDALRPCATRRPRRPPPESAFRRPAAACCPCPCLHSAVRALSACCLMSRCRISTCSSASKCAVRSLAALSTRAPDRHLCHARSERGAGAVGPHRGDARRRGGAGGDAGGNLRRAAVPVGRRVPGCTQHLSLRRRWDNRGAG